MKKTALLCVFAGLLLSSAGYPQESDAMDSQVLVPKDVYVGDTAEVQYSFHSVSSIPLQDGKQLELRFENSPLARCDDVCSIRKMILLRTGNQYTLKLTVIPWQPGTIDLPAFDLIELLNPSSYGFVIDLKPFTVASLADKSGSRTLHPSAPPVLIPGTIYIVYGLIILILLLLALIIRVLMNVRRISEFFKDFMRQQGYNRNARTAMKELHKLEHAGKSIDDREFCARLQSITRAYLEFRFGYAFSSVTSNRIEQVFDGITGGTLSLSQSLRIEELGNMFRRTDYIRYAHGSLDAERLPSGQYAAELEERERGVLISAVTGSIQFFEHPAADDSRERKDA